MQPLTQKQLLHAKQHWPQAVSTALWPYALCSATYLNKVMPTLKGGQSKLKLFSGILVGSIMKVCTPCSALCLHFKMHWQLAILS